jgi:two-component system, OmpR family, sensor kinase
VIAILMVPATRAVTRPLVRLTASARRFAEGDFSHRVPVEGPREVARLGAEMNEMAQRLATLLHTQRQLLADVSHELRSPLARIEVALELSRGAGVGTSHLDSIQADVAELRQLIADILTNSRLELRPDLLQNRVFGAGDVLSETRAKAIASGIDPTQLELEDATGGAEVKGDPELIRHALGNLVDNARKHAPSDKVVVIGARAEGERVLLFVRDQGPGIPAEELPRLFEPFYRTDNSRSRESGGTGLGLSLVRRIAELHGGPPFVISTPGQGSTFGVTLERA